MSTAVPDERTWSRVTGLDFVDKVIDGVTNTPAASMGRRLMLALLVGVGITMTAFGSIFLQNTGPIPLKWWPDIRPVLLMSSGFFLGMQAAWGNASRRRLALWGVILFVVLFHLEEATVHWIGPFPGSITGSRIGLLGTAGSLIALAGIILMHIEVESEHLRRDVIRRGAHRGNAAELAHKLRALGNRRIVANTVGIAALGVFLVAAEQIFGNEASGGGFILLVGGAILMFFSFYIGRLVR